MTLRVVQLASGREWRGGQRQVWLLARELARLGDVDQVVVTGHGTELADRLRGDGVPVHAARWEAGLDLRVLPPALHELRRGAALLHAHDAHAVTLGGTATAFARRPLVATRRVDFPLRRLGFWKRAACVIAISRAVADVLAADGIPADRVRLVHSGIDLEALRQTARLDVRRQLGLPRDALVVLTVGALVAHKDHATLLRAAAALEPRVPGVHWVVVGDGPERPALERQRAALALDGRVHFLGFVDDPARLVADATCFVMSSRAEGLGTSVLDAMALGIPVASTSAGGLPEMLENGAGVLAPPDDPEALADAVMRLLTRPALAGNVRERALAAVERFSARRMAEGVRSVYRSCVSFP